MGSKCTASTVPSAANELLRKLAGKQIIKFFRYSWWDASEVSTHCGVEDDMAFSLTAGPLVIYFECDIVLGFSSDPSLNSVIIWDEAARIASQSSSSLESDSELFSISETGRFATAFWKDLIGDRVSGITILKRAQMNAKAQQRPSEVGLRFDVCGGKSFILSHGLHDDSDDFTVLEVSQVKAVGLEEMSLS
ncbi:hypothetical protein [Pseudomonas corrugata]